MVINLIVFLFISILYIHSSGTSYALKHTLITEQELHSTGFTGYEPINPNLLIYPIKQITEKIELLLIFNKQDKEKYQYTILDKRFKELVFIINFKKTGFLEETVARYNANIGKLIKNNKDFSSNYKDKLSEYIKILKTLQDRYDSISSYRLLIQYAIDTTKRLI
ncbi:hypothetical protein A3H40_04145 [Candidatus Daviesbacteria bacterium RIFCSPLOWO2_02_FULL_38_15]|uniref:DUF5667 domain-containing protein n=1 Tax=Candidatus Daviesbacteria bacterium RIFCSPLOWO2_02_FULL_38_15 TaxID=1797794 RepID=A0A1F5N464_9BACT|nr:MAG: hypothetical protein A3H40_04145 [Candidatus Daviesbacteria bacterium RIFCSPLOWO2_02_FULL_38_15]